MNLESQPNTYQPIMNDPIPMQSAIKLPFDVSTELNIYSRVYITKQADPFRIFHNCEVGGDYIVYGELPDGDKKILFTVLRHFQMCNCCQSCTISLGCCIEYECCNSILAQFDYKRNNVNFYTQGQYIQSGLYCCKCLCLKRCCIGDIFYLRENLEPDNPDFNVGVKKGSTLAGGCCGDILTTYTSQEGLRGPTVKVQCCELCKDRTLGCGCCCSNAGCCGYDTELIVEDANGQQTGTITLFNGGCSKKVEGMCCHIPGRHYLINFPPNASSNEKFQIIADLIHLDSKAHLL